MVSSSKKIPPKVERAEYGWIWDYVEASKKKSLTVNGITFYLLDDKNLLGTPWRMRQVRVPVNYNNVSSWQRDIASFNPKSKNYIELPSEGHYHQCDFSVREAINKAEAAHKKQWLAERKKMRAVRAKWEAQNPEIVAAEKASAQAVVSAETTSAILEFAQELSKARTAIESMLLSLERGTYTGKKCAELHAAMTAVSAGQKTFRNKCCKGKNK